MNQTSTTQQGLIKHGGLHSTTSAHGMRAHNSNKTQAIMCDIAVLAETLFSILPGSWMQISLF